ncbi:GGDEF domain-containing protein [Caldimonas tepidiphila]|uniref:GGDEF domain-containing protein n=1 Tax=Caldimonas tepidiphila TaxID=2315841 RepID=UPI000E5BFDC1|nr:GGDEF domain-containing protein [Caldimonas tepidiphila]
MKGDPVPADRFLDEEARRAVAATLECSELVAGLYDAQDRLRWASASFERVFLRGLAMPVDFPDLLRHGFRHGFGVQIDCGDVEQFLADILPRRRSTPFRAFAVDIVGGQWLWMTETLRPDGWLLSVASDITALKTRELSLQQAHEDMLTVARTDALTGLWSRRRILELGEAALRGCAESGRPFSLALIDLDHFKRINDTQGHDRGDEVLRHFGAHCRALLRPVDALGRLGGEEFLLLLPGAPLEAAQAIVERLRAALPGTHALPYTFSAGLAQALGREPLEAAIRRADGALYEAKRLGRDRSVCAPGG